MAVFTIKLFMNSFNITFKFAVKILICLLCTVNHSIIVLPFISALKLNSNLNVEKATSEHLLNVFPLLSSLSSLCLVSENDDLLDLFVKYFTVRNKILTLVQFGNPLTNNCESVLLIDINSTSDCEKIVSKNYKRPLTFLSVFTTTNLAELEKCVCDSTSSEVMSLYLQQDCVFELSQVFYTPRYFINSNIENILKHRMRSKYEDFSGLNVTASFIEFPPLAFTKHKSDVIDGIDAMLVQELSKKLNFTLQYVVYDNWGEISPDGTFKDGMFGAIRKGNIDIATGCIYQAQKTYSIMDFLPSLSMAQLSFIIKRPEKIDFEWRNFISIFKPSVWYFTMVSYTLIVACYWFGIIRGIPSYKDDWTSSAVILFGRFTMTTSHNYFSSTFTRFILTSWSVFSLLLTTLLSTGIVCSLTLPLYSPRVDTFKQLVEGNYYWTTQYYALIQDDETKDILFNFQDHWSRLFEKQYRYMDAGEVEAKAFIDEKFTFAAQIYDNDLLIIDGDGLAGHKHLSGFRTTRLDSMKYHVSFGVKKNSPLFEPLAKMTTRVLQAGLLQQWRSAVIRRWPLYNTRHMMEEHDNPTFGEPEVMRLHKLRPVFYLLLAGLAASFVIFCVEMSVSLT